MSLNRPTVSSSKRGSGHPLKRAQVGVGLIEVLIAVLVLSIGILGIAALQTRALSDNGSSLNRSAATAATYSIIEAMRLDRAAAVTGLAYNITVTTNACPAQGATLATYQLSQWCNFQLGNFLGKTSTTSGTVACPNTGTGLCTITIQFDDSKASGGVTNFRLVTTAQL